MTIDEHIRAMQEQAEWSRKYAKENCIIDDSLCFEQWKSALICAENCEQIAEWLEELKILRMMVKRSEYLKFKETIKEMDLEIPQHFTKEQSEWVKSYCIKRNKEFYNKALEDFVKYANTMPTVENEDDGYIRPMHLEEMAEMLKKK